MSERLPSVSNEEAKRRIDAGEPLEGVYIERITWSRHNFTGPVTLTDCIIGTLDLNRSTFPEDVYIRRCKIDTFVLSDATFAKKLDLKRSTIFKLRAHAVQFKGDMSCESAQLRATFHRSVFHGKADFGWTRFRGEAKFTEVKFLGGLEARYVSAAGDAVFDKARCVGAASLRNAVFEGELFLRETHWQGDLSLQGAQASLGVDFTNATLHGATDFRNITVGRTINLNRVATGSNQGFRFLGAVAAHVALQREVVEGHVEPEQQRQYRAAAREYGFLRTAFQNINRFEDEDWAYYQFKRMQRKSRGWGWNPLNALLRTGSYLFLDLGCGYGTRPFRTLFVCALLIVLFAAAYYAAASGAAAAQNYGFSPRVNQAIAALDQSLIAFSGGYADLKVSGPLRLVAMAEYLFGVVFIGLFVVAFSRKVIR